MSFDYKAKRFINGAGLDLVERHHTWFGSFSAREQSGLLSREVQEITVNDIYIAARRFADASSAADPIERMQHLDMNFYLAEGILTKVDRASMSASLEVRAPFLDPRIAEFASQLPIDYKLHRLTGKYLLKKAMKDRLPDSIINRSKKGFGIPVADWLRKELNPLMHDLLATGGLKEQGLFDYRFVEKLVREHEQKQASHHKQLWTLMSFELWRRNFMGAR